MARDGFRETGGEITDGIGFTLDVSFAYGRKIDAADCMMRS